MHAITRYILARACARERSTMAGLVLALTSLGVNLSPEVQEALASLATALAGLILVMIPTGERTNIK